MSQQTSGIGQQRQAVTNQGNIIKYSNISHIGVAAFPPDTTISIREFVSLSTGCFIIAPVHIGGKGA